MPDKQAPFSMRAPWTPVAMKWISSANTWIYEKSGGRIGGKFLGAPVMLLTTIGRKSGQPRTKPLLYMRDGDDVICVASKGGMPSHPLWYLNLLANPDCEVRIGTVTEHRRAREATESERAALWPKLAKMYPDFNNYQSWTDRVIPVLVLERA